MHAKREPMQFQGVSEETEVFMEVAWKFDFLFARSWSFWSSASELAQFVQLMFKIFTILMTESKFFFAIPNLLVFLRALQQVAVGM
jgi:acyl carrier protein phosphodiesterase